MAHALYLAFFVFFASPVASFVLPKPPTRHSSSLQVQAQEEEYSILETKPKTEYAALSPGCVVQIEVGNVAMARKAWKKRRRSGSPLLVPCSILSVDRKSLVQWNILYLLQKFGKPLSEIPEMGLVGDDICLSMGDINKYYSSHLGTSLAKHAKALGHDTARSLVRDLFNRKAQKDLGVRLWLPPKEQDELDRPMWLMAPLSRQKAHRLASQAGLLQFTTDDGGTDDCMKHTGVLRMRNKSNGRKNKPPHVFLPLSAALRVSQRAVEQGMIQEGSTHTAVVFNMDQVGDGGSPLMTFSLNPTRAQVRDRRKLKQAGKRHFAKDRRMQVEGEVERNLKDLKVGDGPFVGKVVRLSSRAGAAFVDCGVGRTVSKQKGGGVQRVLGMLRFDDLVKDALKNDESSSELLKEKSTSSVEEDRLVADAMSGDMDWDDDENDDDDVMTVEDLFVDFDDEEGDVVEEKDIDDGTGVEMDVTHLVTIEDGVVTYTDPESGEQVVLSDSESDDDVDVDEDDEDDEEDIMFENMSPEERLDMISKIMNDRKQERSEASGKHGDDVASMFSAASPKDSHRPAFLKVGDSIDVYIKSVYKQSGRFMLTLDPSVQGRKAKDMKKETEAEKKLARLVEKMGGLERIEELEGTECDGIVQATSQTGDWCYVKPTKDDLPVGVAKLASGVNSVSKGLAVRVRIDGIDETRGQLAMTVL